MVKTNDFILRYSNCWEDVDLLLAQLSRVKGSKICSVASGGENSLSLLTLDPELLVIVDVNPLQLFLTELKMISIKHLDYEDCLQFFGFLPSKNRWTTFNKICNLLSIEARNYWESQNFLIEQGIIHSGHTEKNIRFFANYVRPLFHTRKDVMELVSLKTEQEQAIYYNDKWNNVRWQLIFKIFFSRTIMKKAAPDPDFLNYYNGNISSYLFNKTSAHFSSKLCQSNPILRYILLGNFGELLPHYVCKEQFTKIKNSKTSVKYYLGFAEEPAEKYGQFDAFNLSNIFEYTTLNEFDELSKKLMASGKKDALYMYWNILMPRKISELINTDCINLLDTSITSVEDKGWLYSRCLVDKKN